MEAGNDVDVRKGDVVLGRAKITDPPSTVLVSSTGLGVVLLDQYGLNYALLTRGDPALTVVSLNGQTRFTKKLNDLFDAKAVGEFPCTMSGCPGWLDAAWIDEQRRELVIIGANGTNEVNPLAVVRLDTGVARVGSSQDILQAIVTRNPEGLTPALEAAIRSNLREAKPHLKAILRDAAQPLDARLRCAVFLSSLGDTSGKAFMGSSAVTVSRQLLQHPDWQDLENDRLGAIYHYAVKHLPDVLGEDSIPILCEVARLQGYPATVYDSFRRMGRKAVPVLIELSNNDKEVRGQVMAAELLAEIKPPTDKAIAALTKSLGSAAKTRSGCALRWVAATSLGEIGPPARSALPALAKLLNDQDEDVREAAGEAIRNIQTSPRKEMTPPRK
jgi:hypothetical protein